MYREPQMNINNGYNVIPREVVDSYTLYITVRCTGHYKTYM